MTEEIKSEETPGEQKPSGKTYVDFNEFEDDVRQKIEPRFKHVYSNMKEYERLFNQVIEDNKALATRVQEMSDWQHEASKGGTVQSLNQQKVEALEAGEYSKVAEIDNEIRRIEGMEAPKAPEQTATPPETVDAESAARVQAWAQERAEDGSLVRPWVDNTHPAHAEAQRVANEVKNDPSIAQMGTEAILAEVDRRMSSKSNGASTVVNSTGDIRPPGDKKTPSLSAEQKIIAQRMGFSEADYAKIVQKNSDPIVSAGK